MAHSNISKTKIKRHLRMKTNPFLVETIKLASKQKAWLPIAKALSSSTRRQASVNLSEIDEKAKVGDTIIVLGKVLSLGDLTKKVRICSLGISESAKKKLKESKSEAVSISEEIRKNPKAEGLKLIQ